MKVCLRTIICLAIGFLSAPALCAQNETVTARSTSESTLPSLDEFQTWATKFVAKPNADILLPEDWFNKQFEPELAKKLNAEYRNLAKGIGSIDALIAAQKEKGNTEVHIDRCIKAIDRNATGLQNAALQRMNSPTPLFTIRLTKPNEPRGFTLASFVSVDGKFCFAGKMAALNPKPDDLATNVLCTTPLKMMEKTLQDKGLIETSAEEYLKKTGVLK